MLANPLKSIGLLTAIALLIVATGGFSFGQNQQIQTPSQRYQPLPTNNMPPSVHVAPAQAKQISGPRLRRSLTDQTLPDWNRKSNQTIAQTSFQDPATSGEPAVPSILAGAQDESKKAAESLPPPHGMSAARAASMKRSIEGFAPQVDQIKGSSIPFKPVSTQANPAPKSATEQSQEKFAFAQQQETASPSSQPATQQPRVASFESPTQFSAAPSQSLPERPMSPSNSMRSGMERPLGPTDSSQTGAIQEATTSRIKPRTRKIDTNVRPASRQVDIGMTNQEKAAMSMNAPGIEVQAFGPQSIGINKAASFRVEVANNSSAEAKGVLVGINVPDWVDVQSTNLTTGNKDITDGQDQARVLWTIDRIPAGKTETATVVAVPRKAQGFGLAVEWTLVPKRGEVNIQVTEPRLEMSMSGPGEVQFGEEVDYSVTVRNPGTGDAENVVVMLPEELGGESDKIGTIKAGTESTFTIQLLARTAGELTLTTSASADGNLSASASQDLVVRRAVLDISIEGPALKYAGTIGRYKVNITNIGDATGEKLEAGIAFPSGVNFLGGIESFDKTDNGFLWQIGSLAPNQSKTFEIDCELQGSGDLQFSTAVRQTDKLNNVASATAACITTVETIADLVLSVKDPKGPLPTGEETKYEITVQNRGSRAAKGVELLMQFSEGIEPSKATGLQSRIVPGQVVFSPIQQIDPGQTMTFEVSAIANKRGTHVFRAFLSCEESDSREVAEGTTKFFGDEFEVESTRENATADQSNEPSAFRRH